MKFLHYLLANDPFFYGASNSPNQSTNTNELTPIIIAVVLGMIALVFTCVMITLIGYSIHQNRKAKKYNRENGLQNYPIPVNNQVPNNYQAPAQAAPKNDHVLLKVLLSFIIIGALIFGVVTAVKCATNPENTDGTGKLTSRSARYSDVKITQSDEFTLTTKFILVPQTNIDNLEVTIHFSDSSQRIIKSKTKTIGNVVRNGQYTFSFSLNDFSLQETLNIEYWRYEVTGGTVSYFS